MALATVVDWNALLKTVVAAFIAGVGVTLVFSVAIFGAARFADMNRDGRPVAAAAFVGLSVLVPLPLRLSPNVSTRPVLRMTRPPNASGPASGLAKSPSIFDVASTVISTP